MNITLFERMKVPDGKMVCPGFSSQALYRTEVHDTVVWEKFKAMRQGADLATKQLWSKR